MNPWEKLGQVLKDNFQNAEDRLCQLEKKTKALEAQHDGQGFLNDRIAVYADADLLNRLEKLENVVSKEEMPKTKELDGLVAELIHDVQRLKHAVRNNLNKLVGVTEQEMRQVNEGRLSSRTISVNDPVPNPDPTLGDERIGSKEQAIVFPKPRFLPDGFQSTDYSFAFDAAASPKNLPFSVALEYLKAGRRIKRASSLPDSYLYKRDGVDQIQYRPHTVPPEYAEVYNTYRLTEEDVFATDWMVIEEQQNQ